MAVILFYFLVSVECAVTYILMLARRLQEKKRKLRGGEGAANEGQLSQPFVFVPSRFDPATQSAMQELGTRIATLLSSTVFARGNYQVKSLGDILNELYLAGTSTALNGQLSSIRLCLMHVMLICDRYICCLAYLHVQSPRIVCCQSVTRKKQSATLQGMLSRICTCRVLGLCSQLS
jgi:hypothetical protein